MPSASTSEKSSSPSDSEITSVDAIREQLADLTVALCVALHSVRKVTAEETAKALEAKYLNGVRPSGGDTITTSTTLASGGAQ